MIPDAADRAERDFREGKVRRLRYEAPRADVLAYVARWRELLDDELKHATRAFDVRAHLVAALAAMHARDPLRSRIQSAIAVYDHLAMVSAFEVRRSGFVPRALVIRRVRYVRRKVSPKTVNNRLGVLSTLLRYAAREGLIDEPRLRCHVRAVSADIVAVPMADVERLIAAAADARYRVAILLAAEAGLRVGEIRGLQWGDVEAGQITIRRAVDTRGNVTSPKHDKRRVIPTSPSIETALAGLPRRGLFVVSRRDGGILGYWAMREKLLEIYERAGVKAPTMPFHSMRHTFGTELAARGVPLPVVRDLMGHSDIKTTLRYVTVADAQRRDAIAIVFGRGQQVGNAVGVADEGARKPK